MNLSILPVKWLLSGVAVLSLMSGFIAGRITGGSDFIFSTGAGTSSASGGTGLKAIFGGNQTANGGSTNSSNPSAIGAPAGGYTKESFLELTKSINPYTGRGPKKLREMLVIQESLARQDVRALVEELLADKSIDSRQALYLAMGVLAEQSPKEALELILSQPDPSNQQMSSGMFQAVAAGMEQDPEGTLARVSAIENTVMRKKALSSAVNALAVKDPSQALDFYLSTELSSQNDHSISTIFYQWSRKDPAAAAAALSKIGNSKQRQNATSGLVRNWVLQDSDAAWEWVNAQPLEDQSYQDPRYYALTTWAGKDPKAALAAAATLPDKLRNYAMPNVISNWARKDPEAAMEWITSNDNPAMMEGAFRNIAYSDTIEPQRVFNLVMEKMPAGNSFRNTVSQVISRWAQKDPVAAANAVQALPPGDAFNSSASNLIRQWSKDDPAAAYQWASSLPEGSGKKDTIRNWFSSVASKDPQLAQSYYYRLDPKEQSNIASNIASSLASTNPDAALQFSASITDEKLRKRTHESVARSWAYQNPGEAARWASTLPEGEKSSAMRNVVDAWANKNVEAAAEWLASMPTNKSLDAATQSLSRKLVGVDPEAAISWAGSITDEKQRQRAVYDVARQWIRNDPASGKLWVQRSNLSPEDKDKLLK